NGPWFLGEIASNVQYGLAPLPKIKEAGDNPMRPWMTVEGAFVAAPSKNKNAAYDLIMYLTDKPAGIIMALEGRQSPANQSAYTDATVAADPVLKSFHDKNAMAASMPNLTQMRMGWRTATTGTNSVAR